jgi:tRNA A37 threonylcarbamoyladenosine dehydratase
VGITLPAAARIPESRIAALARFANRAQVTLITRMPAARRVTTLAAFVHSLEATARDDFWKCWRSSLHELFGDAEKADKKTRLRSEFGGTRLLALGQ